MYRAITTHLIHKAVFSRREGATGAVTLIQRFGSALNLNIHFHIMFLNGVYGYRDDRPPRFHRVKAPDKDELEDLVQQISQRVGRCLERQGLLEQDTESAWLDLDPAGDRAFFVTTKHAHLFSDVPENIEALYVGPRYLLYENFGHTKSIKTIETILRGR